MKPPLRLSAKARAEWHRIRKAIESRGMKPEEYAGALENYVRQYDVVLTCETAWENAGCPVLTDGAGEDGSGFAYQHPLLKTLTEQRKALAVLGDRVGADPRSARTARPAQAPGRPRGDAPLKATGIGKTASQRLKVVK